MAAVDTPIWTFHRPDVRPLGEMFVQIWLRRELLVLFILRDLRVRYAQVLLGSLWVVLQPLLTMAVLTLVFARIVRVELVGTAPYAVWCLSGLLPFQYFSRALTATSATLAQNGALLTKVSFPRLILLLAALCPPLVDFALSLGILVLLILWFGIPLTVNILALPFFLAYCVALVLALGTWLSAACVHYRDVQQLMPFLLQAIMLLSPIAYPVSMVPAGSLRTLFQLNPLSLVVEGCRWSLLGAPAPEPMQYLSVPCVLAVLIGGLWNFRREERFFADVV